MSDLTLWRQLHERFRRDRPPEPRSVRATIEAEAELLRAALAARLPAAAQLVRAARWQRGRPDAPTDAIFDAGLDAAQARDVLARWHRFKGWDDALAAGDAVVDPRFEAAADAIVEGDGAALEALLAEEPALATARSPFGHHATLLHHVAANGIEETRQWQSPPGAVAIATLLLDAGAAPDATCDCYGGGATVLGLLVSSDHPMRAGVELPLLELLIDRGAAVDGPAGDGDPLLTALAFGHFAAAEALARRGARLDSLAAAAGVGRADRVAELLPAANPVDVDRAFLRAVAGDRREVVELLLAHGVNLAARDEQGMTGLHLAAWRGHRALVTRLIAAGAPLEVHNDYGGTVLGMTRWAARNAPAPGVDYDAIIAELIAAGAADGR